MDAPPPDSKRFFVRRITDEAGSQQQQAQVLIVRSRETFVNFKKRAGEKLNIKAERVFLSNGAEIHSLGEMQNNDTVYIASAGMQPRQQETFHLSVLGAGGVGKSALTLRFVRDYFVQYWDPTIEDAYRKTVDVDDILCMLEILDTAGQDDFDCLRAQWMADKDGYILVYSMDEESTLKELQPFFDLHLQLNETKNPMPPIVVVANKADIVKQDPSKLQVSTERGKAIAELYNAQYIETSARTGQGVDEAFKVLVREVRNLRDPPAPKPKWCFLL